MGNGAAFCASTRAHPRLYPSRRQVNRLKPVTTIACMSRLHWEHLANCKRNTCGIGPKPPKTVKHPVISSPIKPGEIKYTFLLEFVPAAKKQCRMNSIVVTDFGIMN